MSTLSSERLSPPVTDGSSAGTALAANSPGDNRLARGVDFHDGINSAHKEFKAFGIGKTLAILSILAGLSLGAQLYRTERTEHTLQNALPPPATGADHATDHPAGRHTQHRSPHPRLLPFQCDTFSARPERIGPHQLDFLARPITCCWRNNPRRRIRPAGYLANHLADGFIERCHRHLRPYCHERAPASHHPGSACCPR